MKKTPDTSTGKQNGRVHRRPCLLAYTLNNSQPVICTLVADQPYFYMDEDLPEDDDLLDAEIFADLEKDLLDLKKKMDAYERLSKSHERDPAKRLDVFRDEAKKITDSEKSGAEILMQPADKIISILRQSRMAQALLDFAQTHSVFIVESEQVSGARYDRESGKILVHPALGEEEQCLLVVRELRRHWQHRKGVLIHPLTFYPDQAILINRAQIADLTIAMIRVSWELQLAGTRHIWDHLENSALGDVARSFAREAFLDFRSLANGKASSAAFESWFLSERCRHQDKKLIQAMLADHQGYVFTHEQASRNVSIELISNLGEQPFGKNYLAPYAQMIISDPIFNEVRDRSNANFLWFIKFERSFRETEQALQSDDGINETGSPASSHLSAGKADNGTNSIIIQLDRSSGSNKRSERGQLDDGRQRTNVIHVRFGESKGA